MSRKVPPGGPATCTGIYYQMLLTLSEVASIELTFPSTATKSQWIVEPSGGGDLKHTTTSGRTVYQAKSRSTNKKWSLAELVVEVIPDFLRSEPTTSTNYLFVTDGALGDIKPLKRLGEYLSCPPPQATDEDQALWLKGIKALKSQLPKPPKDSTPNSNPSASDFLDRLVEILMLEMKGPSYPSVDPEILRGWLALLLPGLNVRQISETNLEGHIFDILDQIGVIRENRRSHLSTLIGELIRLSRSGDLRILWSSIFSDCTIPLTHWANIRSRSFELAKQTLQELGYVPSLDVRDDNVVIRAILLSDHKIQNRTVILRGGSGYGKTWAMAGAIWRLIRLPIQPALVHVDQSGNLLRDLDLAAQKFCESIWQIDQPLPFKVLCRKVHNSVKLDDDSQPWLIVFIDGVADGEYLNPRQAETLRTQGVSVIIALTTKPGAVPELGDQQVGLFTPRQALRFLENHLGSNFQTPPPDVVDLIRSPLLAKVYVQVARGEAAWQPTNEYELVEKHWRGFGSSAVLMAGLQKLELLAASLLDGEPYPWLASRLLEAGLTETAFQHFLASGLLVAVADHRKVRIWHDRILEWAIAEGLVQSWLAQTEAAQAKAGSADETIASSTTILQTKVSSAGENRPSRGRYGYVAFDVLWLMLKEKTPYRLKAAVELLKESTPEYRHRFPIGSIETLGERLGPALEEWVFTLPTSEFASATIAAQLGEVAARLEPKCSSVAGFAAIQSSSAPVQVFGLKILAQHPNSSAANRLLELQMQVRSLRTGETTGENKVGPERLLVHMDSELENALILSLSNLSDGGEKAFLGCTAADQFCTILGLLPKIPKGRAIWLKHKAALLARSVCSAQGIRFAAFCIYCFIDRSEEARAWLDARVNSFSSYAEASMARLALWTWFGEILPLPKETANGFEIACSIRWWPRRVFLDDRESYAVLAAEVGKSMEFQVALEYLPMRLCGTSLGFAQDTISKVTSQLDRQTAEIEAGVDPPKYILFESLSSLADADTLLALWGAGSTELESALVRYLIALGPPESRAKGRSDHALDFLTVLSGKGIDEVAGLYLASAPGFYCFLRAFPLLERSCSPSNAGLLASLAVASVADDDNEYAARMCIAILCHHGFWDLAVDGIIKYGLKNLRDLEELEVGLWPDSAFDVVLTALRDEPSAGALLALGLSGRKEYSHLAREAIRDSSNNSEILEAAWLALDLLDDRSDETLKMVLASLSDATCGRYRGLLNIAYRCNISVMNSRDEERLISDLNLPHLAEEKILNYLDFLRAGFDRPLPVNKIEFVNFVWEQAFSRAESFFSGTRVAAIHALSVLAPEDSLLACKDALRSLKRPTERLQVPRVMLALDRTEALRQFYILLTEESDWRLVVAIGEALAQEGEAGLEVILSWLQADDEILREGAAMAARAFPWSERLDQQLRVAMNDIDWRVRDVAEPALLQILQHREILRLRDLLEKQTTLARKWAAMEAAVKLGHPNISGIRPLWFYPLINGLPYFARKFARKTLEEKSKKLLSKLEKKKRDYTRLVIRRSLGEV